MNKLTKSYRWILFDADDTLFHFDSRTGLERMFSKLGVPFNEQDYLDYQTVNTSMWIDYQSGKLTPQQLRDDRFIEWSKKINISSPDLNKHFIDAMCEICSPLDGAINLLNALKGKAKLGIITNGFSELLDVRLQRAELQNHFDLLVISEKVGIPKPNPGIFKHALAEMGNPLCEEVLMVGDNPESDILGGISVGLHTCWLNVDKKTLPENVKPHYEVTSLAELENLLIENE